MKVWILEGQHHTVPNRIVKVYASRDLAVKDAVALANIILKDIRDEDDPPATADDWEERLEDARTTMGDLYGCDEDFVETSVEISEHELIGEPL